MIVYAIETRIEADEFISVLKESGLGVRRPIGDLERIKDMLRYGNLIVTARDCGILIGVARSLSDYAFCTYLSDLAVSKIYQKKGIGVELIRQTKLAAPEAKLILLSAPDAVKYYPRIGMHNFTQCYFLDDVKDLVNS